MASPPRRSPDRTLEIHAELADPAFCAPLWDKIGYVEKSSRSGKPDCQGAGLALPLKSP